MFPNPQAALPLLPRPGVDHYRQLAEDLVAVGRAGDAGALERFVDGWIASLAGALRAPHGLPRRVMPDEWARDVRPFARRQLAAGCSLDDAHSVLARCHGFTTWAGLVAHVDRLAREGIPFEAAADAVLAGDEAALTAILAADPALVRARSDREHAATLLIYTAANGVESFRQLTPANIVRIAQILLDAGADVNATSDLYGGACSTLGLAATSAHPREAGVQLALLQLLLDRGARIEDGIGGGTHGAVLACLGNGCPEAAAYLADRGARVQLVEAAGLGRQEAAERLLEAAAFTPEQLDEALSYATGYGRTAIAELLVRCGARDIVHGSRKAP